jgi:hypothetical protein
VILVTANAKTRRGLRRAGGDKDIFTVAEALGDKL